VPTLPLYKLHYLVSTLKIRLGTLVTLRTGALEMQANSGVLNVEANLSEEHDNNLTTVVPKTKPLPI
jgi:hypothetical protein